MHILQPPLSFPQDCIAWSSTWYAKWGRKKAGTIYSRPRICFAVYYLILVFPQRRGSCLGVHDINVCTLR